MMRLLVLAFGVLFLTILLTSSHVATSATYYWVGSNSVWTDPSNWNPSTGYPVNGDNVVIDGGTVSPELSGDITLNNFTISNGKSLDLKGYVLTINGQAAFNSGTIFTSVSSSGNLIIVDNNTASTTIGTNVTTTMQFGNSLNQVDVVVKTANILLKGGVTFYGDVELEKTGGTKESWYTGNVFNGNVLLKLSSSVSDLETGILGTGQDVFNGEVTIASSGTKYINICGGAANTTIFNEPVVVTASNDGAVYFAGNTSGFLNNSIINFNKGVQLNNTGTNYVAFARGNTNSGQTINVAQGYSISTGTFSSGKLYLRKVFHTGSVGANIQLTGTSTLELWQNEFHAGTIINTNDKITGIMACSFQGITNITTVTNIEYLKHSSFTGTTTITGGRVKYLEGNTFSGGVTISKKGNLNDSDNNDYWLGDNVFGQLGSSEEIIINCEYGLLQLAHTNGEIFNQPVKFNSIVGANSVSGNIEFTKGINEFNSTVELNSAGTSYIHFGVMSDCKLTFNEKVTINCSSSGPVYFAQYSDAEITFNNGIEINNTGTADVRFAYSPTKYPIININGKISASFSTGGRLFLKNITQSYNTSLTEEEQINEIELIGSGILEILNCTFNSPSNFTAPEISNVKNSNFISDVIFIKTGAATYEADFWEGGNTYGSALNKCSTTAVINCNKGIIHVAHFSGDTFYSLVIFNTINDGIINVFQGNSEFNCVTTVNNNGSRVWIGASNGTVLFKDDLVLNSSGGTGINIGSTTNPPNIVTFDEDKGIKTGESGITGGNVTLVNIIQSGEANNDIKFSNLANQLQIENCTLTGGFFEAPRFVVYSNVFNDFTTFNKVNNVNNTSSEALFKGNTFEAYVEIINNSGTVVTICPNIEDVENYYGDVRYVLNSTGNISAGRAGTCEYHGDVEYVKGEDATGYIFVSNGGINKFRGNIKTNFAFGHANSNGINYFIGSEDQTIEYTGSLTTKPSPLYGKLAIDKPSGKLLLQMPITVVFEAIFIKGNIVTSRDHILTFYSNSSTHSGASDLSFIEGPASKRNSGAFTFPIGKTYYRPISIGSQIYSGAIMTAEYFESTPPTVENVETPLKDLSICEYWEVTRAGQSADVNVTLHWQPGLCSPVNPTSMEIAWFNSSTNKWTSLSSTSLTGDNNNGSITSTAAKTGYFTFGYKTKLIINTSEVNTTEFNITSGVEPFSAVLTSGSGGGTTGVATLAGSQNLTPGVYVVHPDLAMSGSSKPIDISILGGGQYKDLKLRLHVNEHSNVIKVEAEQEGVYKEMAEDYYTLTSNAITFHKQKPLTAPAYSISTNLENGILFDHTTNSTFEVEVPGFSNISLDIYDQSNTKVYTTTGNQWDGKSNYPYLSTEYVEQGVYKFEVTVNGTHKYFGQLIFK